MRSTTDALAEVVGPDHVVTDADVLVGVETDWTGRRWGSSRALVRPATVHEVVGVLDVCAARGVPVVVQGGNTGLVGGGVPVGGEVVLSTTRLREVGLCDADLGEITVGAGATLAEVQRTVRTHGWDVGVDLASRDSATIGGMVATNAGGSRVVRNGPMKAQVTGLRAVLVDGSVIDRLTGPSKDNSGYDVVSLLSGSEGTLAVVTDVRLRLVRELAFQVTALVAFADIAAASRWVTELRSSLPSLAAAELMTAEGIELVRAGNGGPTPLASRPAYAVLVDARAQHDPTDELLAAIEALDEADAVVATDHAGCQRLWALRESHTDAINRLGTPLKLDVSVPLAELDDLVAQAHGVVAVLAPRAQLVVFGHLAEGNLHLNVVGPDLPEAALTDRILRLVAGLGGSISAEHGIGRAKAPWLALTRSPGDIAAMSALKNAWDPQWLLGPGVLLQRDRVPGR